MTAGRSSPQAVEKEKVGRAVWRCSGRSGGDGRSVRRPGERSGGRSVVWSVRRAVARSGGWSVGRSVGRSVARSGGRGTSIGRAVGWVAGRAVGLGRSAGRAVRRAVRRVLRRAREARRAVGWSAGRPVGGESGCAFSGGRMAGGRAVRRSGNRLGGRACVSRVSIEAPPRTFVIHTPRTRRGAFLLDLVRTIAGGGAAERWEWQYAVDNYIHDTPLCRRICGGRRASVRSIKVLCGRCLS